MLLLGKTQDKHPGDLTHTVPHPPRNLHLTHGKSFIDPSFLGGKGAAPYTSAVRVPFNAISFKSYRSYFHFFLPHCLHGLLPGPFLLSYLIFVFIFPFFVVFRYNTQLRQKRRKKSMHY